MDDESKGLYKKYEVKKLSDPEKEIDAIVLEFDDPIARVGIKSWAREMLVKGYIQVYKDAVKKINEKECWEVE